MSQKTSHRYNGPDTISNDELSDLPLRSFSGEITVINDGEALTRALDEITRNGVVGFDTETRPSFKKGQIYKVSLLQLATERTAFLIRLQYTGFTSELVNFLENDSIVKTGVGIRDDLNALKRLHNFTPGGFIDLVPLARGAGLKVESVKKLTGLLLGFRISKSSQTSNWDAEKLTRKQVEYAATDAWVCLKLYHTLAGQNSI